MKISSCGLAKLSALYSRMDCYGKLWHNFVALGLRLLAQLKTWTIQQKRYCDIAIPGASCGTRLFVSRRKDTKAVNVVLSHADKVKS